MIVKHEFEAPSPVFNEGELSREDKAFFAPSSSISDMCMTISYDDLDK